MPKTPVPYAGQQHEVPFPFGPDWQVRLLKLLLVDDGSMDIVLRHVKATYFQAPETKWLFTLVWTYWSKYGQVPSFDALRYYAAKDGGELTPTLPLMIQQVEQAPMHDREMMREELLDWARQNHFYSSFKEAMALWNHGKRAEAIDNMRRRQDELLDITWKSRERVFYAEELSRREQLREAKTAEYGETGDSISTGIPDLDAVMNGGLSPGELGIHVAYAKGGKSTLLMNHGAVAAQLNKNVAHFVLEGSVQQVLDRYDAFFAHEAYWKVKLGMMGSATYNALFNKLQTIKQRIVVIGLLEKFDYTILDVNSELLDMRRVHGWRPDLVIIDYGDLLRGRHGPYQAQWNSEVDAFRDMKLLANRGYAIWTASQARRPDTKTYDTAQHLIKVSQVAGAIEKARVCDYIGSLNATNEEKEQGWLRLYAELYRDNAAGKAITLATEPSQLRFVGVVKDPPSEGVGKGPGVAPATPPIGYVQPPASPGQSFPSIPYGGVLQK